MSNSSSNTGEQLCLLPSSLDGVSPFNLGAGTGGLFCVTISPSKDLTLCSVALGKLLSGLHVGGSKGFGGTLGRLGTTGLGIVVGGEHVSTCALASCVSVEWAVDE